MPAARRNGRNSSQRWTSIRIWRSGRCCCRAITTSTSSTVPIRPGLTFRPAPGSACARCACCRRWPRCKATKSMSSTSKRDGPAARSQVRWLRISAAIAQFCRYGNAPLVVSAGTGLGRCVSDGAAARSEDGLGVLLLNSNAEAHFSFTNALGLVSAEQWWAHVCNGPAVSAGALDRCAASSPGGISESGQGLFRADRDGLDQRHVVCAPAPVHELKGGGDARPSPHRLDRRLRWRSRSSPRRLRSWRRRTTSRPASTSIRLRPGREAGCVCWHQSVSRLPGHAASS